MVFILFKIWGIFGIYLGIFGEELFGVVLFLFVFGFFKLISDFRGDLLEFFSLLLFHLGFGYFRGDFFGLISLEFFRNSKGIRNSK